MIKLDISILWNIINIFVLFLILKRFLIQPVLAVIEKRQTLIDESFETAKEKQQDADKLKGEYIEKLAAIHDQANMIIAKAQNDMAISYDRTLQEANSKAESIVKNAKEEAEVEKKQALASARNEISTLVMDATEKLVSSMDLTNTNKEAYDQFIENMDASFEFPKDDASSEFAKDDASSKSTVKDGASNKSTAKDGACHKSTVKDGACHE